MLGHVDRNIFNVISGGFGTAQVAPAAGGDAPAGVHAETTADSVAQKMLMAKVCVCVWGRVSHALHCTACRGRLGLKCAVTSM